jgi:lipopolysaccharide biosynthesis glycosyltransferase
MDSTPEAVPECDAFHVAFCVDNHYFRSMGATIASMLHHNQHVRFVFHIFAFAVAEEHRTRLRQLERRFGVHTHIHLIDPVQFSQFSHFIASTYYSPSIFTRLLIPAVLRDVTDKVLYLDADILCVGKVDELAQRVLGDVIALVVPDAEATTVRRAAALKLSQPKYFNSGVMLMNVPLWIEQRITEQAVETMLNDGGRDLRFPDQDALNLVLDGRAQYIEQKWNVLYGLIGDLENGIRRMKPLDDPRFIHFAGAVKPWNDWCLHESRELFYKYHQMSPWGDMPLDQVPQNYKEMRMHSRFLLQRGKTLESIRWYLRYLRARPSKLPAFLR